jgi:hypothetical protein
VFSFFQSYGPVDYFFYALLVAAFVVEAWAFLDAIRRPAASFVAAGKRTKPIWLIITGVALLIGIGCVLGELTLFGSFLALPIVGFVASAIYMADVRPKIKSLRSTQRMGPYGPW